MALKRPPADLWRQLTPATVEALATIDRLHVCHHAETAASGVREGAQLLGIASVANDKDGDGFRYLIGVPKGASISPHLKAILTG